MNKSEAGPGPSNPLLYGGRAMACGSRKEDLPGGRTAPGSLPHSLGRFMLAVDARRQERLQGHRASSDATCEMKLRANVTRSNYCRKASRGLGRVRAHTQSHRVGIAWRPRVGFTAALGGVRAVRAAGAPERRQRPRPVEQ